MAASEPSDRIPPPGVGIHHHIAEEVYHSWDAMSQSQVKPFLRSPRQYLLYRSRGISSDALRLGSLTDTLVFEPGEFAKRFTMRPATYQTEDGETKKWNANANICKAMLGQYEATGLPIIDAREHREASMLAKAVRNHPVAEQRFSKGEAQLSLVWKDSESGVLCKARLDWLSDCISDLKTARDAKEGGLK